MRVTSRVRHHCVGISAAPSHSPRTLSDCVSVRIGMRREALLKDKAIAY
ncbi:hypothetical protein AVDCRST_MAG94-3488 [uncultured Leptolyngbya sp.]|uniref:Uncharacterized protein n=1 Tax=uncultured Leptolyngbya sp. TaxID=332963 RepID=A0A6J4MLM7_9CYAN|nr:hypothetical protein AVDCRST_MAG94-3488 [uncultured Leptolyngbya sp.]